MTMKDGIKLGIGFAIGKFLVNFLIGAGTRLADPKWYREMKKTNPEITRYTNQVHPCKNTIMENHSESKAKIGFAI